MNVGRCWCEVNTKAIEDNYDSVRSKIPSGSKYLAIVKADGYGHGATNVASILKKKGADFFGVATLEEGIQLRENGIQIPILILGYTPPFQASLLHDKNLTQTLYSTDYAQALSAAAKENNVTIDCHIKIDTGMSRIGFDGSKDDTIDEVAKIAVDPSLKITGIFTHYAVSDEAIPESIAYTKMQYDRFCHIVEGLRYRHIDVGIRHASNSAATLLYPEMALDMCRVGIIGYGYHPDICTIRTASLMPAMSLYSVITMVKEIPADTSVSYGRIYQSTEPRKIATVAIGYADGVPRTLSNQGNLLINGKKAPIVGRVCMDQLMVDVTHINQVAMGDIATLIGGSDEARITFDDWAKWDQSIAYEMMCGISKRVPRIYI